MINPKLLHILVLLSVFTESLGEAQGWGEPVLHNTDLPLHSIDNESTTKILYRDFLLKKICYFNGRKKKRSKLEWKVVSSTRAESSLLDSGLQSYPGGLFGLCCPVHWLLPPSPVVLFPRGWNDRGYHEQLQQQHQQKQQALDPRFPVLCWAGAAPGVSWVVDICRLRISIRSDPMGC